MSSAASRVSVLEPDQWRVMAFVILAVRWVQGWIYWGGGSRRFLYAPSKLDPDAHHWLANKFQSAMPGAVLGLEQVVGWLLHHGSLLLALLTFISAMELLCGLGLLLGAFTRLSALISMLISAALMLLFGWQGATCIDEWTMSASNFAMGAVVLAAGGGAWSVDSWWMRRRPAMANARWFRWLGSGPWPLARLEQWGKGLAILSMVFAVGFYHYYRGSVITPYHKGPVSPSKHTVSLSKASLSPNGALQVKAYLNGGTAAVPAYLIAARVVDSHGRVVEQWDGKALSALPATAVQNEYPYNRFKPGLYGLEADVGAKAWLRLPPAAPGVRLAPDTYTVVLQSIERKSFNTLAQVGP